MEMSIFEFNGDVWEKSFQASGPLSESIYHALQKKYFEDLEASISIMHKTQKRPKIHSFSDRFYARHQASVEYGRQFNRYRRERTLADNARNN